MLPINPRSAGMKYSTIGLELAFSVIFGWWAGSWLDGKFDTAPFLEISGFGAGLIAGFRSLFRAAKQMQQDADLDTQADAAAAAAARGMVPAPDDAAGETTCTPEADEPAPADADAQLSASQERSDEH
ncbi:MAG: AtpZ/AtpI family protein [Polyangiaceae bacterium]